MLLLLLLLLTVVVVVVVVVVVHVFKFLEWLFHVNLEVSASACYWLQWPYKDYSNCCFIKESSSPCSRDKSDFVVPVWLKEVLSQTSNFIASYDIEKLLHLVNYSLIFSSLLLTYWLKLQRMYKCLNPLNFSHALRTTKISLCYNFCLSMYI